MCFIYVFFFVCLFVKSIFVGFVDLGVYFIFCFLVSGFVYCLSFLLYVIAMLFRVIAGRYIIYFKPKQQLMEL